MAAMETKFAVIARETVKPSSPTSSHLRSFKLCRMDQFNIQVYVPIILFYTSSTDSITTAGGGGGSGGHKVGCGENATKRSQRLKESLSEVLTRFYHLAGRIKDHLSIDCNDEGVDFLEARVNCPLSDILEHPSMESLKHCFLSKPLELTGYDPLLFVQASFFTCGGMALGIRICHKIADAATFCTFIKGWANTALGSPNAVIPEFNVASLFPPIDPFPASASPLPTGSWTPNGIARRFVFQGSKIAALKAKTASTTVQNPTRVEAVSVLIWKCAIRASRRSKSIVSPRPSALLGLVNMRASLVPPLSQYSCGNITGLLRVQVANESEIDLPSGVCCFRKAVSECRHQRLLDDGNTVPLKPDEINCYRHASWCRMPFYEADFGWGMPTWVTNFMAFLPGTIVLMDTRDGDGIEAWVKLIEEEMALFECDSELLEFASLNPSAL